MNEVGELLQKFDGLFAAVLEDHPYINELDTLTCETSDGKSYSKNILDFVDFLFEQAYDYDYLEDSDDGEDDELREEADALREEADALFSLAECLRGLSDFEKRFINWFVIYKYSNAANDVPIPSRGGSHVLDYTTRKEQALRLLPLVAFASAASAVNTEISELATTVSDERLVNLKNNIAPVISKLQVISDYTEEYLAYFTDDLSLHYSRYIKFPGSKPKEK